MFENATSKSKFGKPRYKPYGLHMCLNFEELGSRSSPPFWGVISVQSQLQSKTSGLQGLKPSFPLGVGNELVTIFSNKSGTNLETKLLKVRHMSRSKFFYLGLPNAISKPMFSNVCGIHMTHPSNNL